MNPRHNDRTNHTTILCLLVVSLAFVCNCASFTYGGNERTPEPSPPRPIPFQISIDEEIYCRRLGDGMAFGSSLDKDPYASLMADLHLSVTSMGGNAYRIFHQRGALRADFYVYLCPERE